MRFAKQGLWRAISFVGLGCLPACGVILGFPETKEDDNYGKTDSGFYADGAPIGDGNIGSDGTTGGDGSSGGDGSTGDDGGPFVPCGADGKNCHGGECLAGVCQPKAITTGLSDPLKMATDGTYLFVIQGSDELDRVDIATGDTQHFVMSESTLNAVSVANGYVYFTRDASGTNASSVSRCSVTAGCGGVGNRTDYLASSGRLPYGVAATASQVVWGYNDATGGIVHCSNATGSCTTTSSATTTYVLDLRLDGNALYWIGGTSQPAFAHGVSECSDFTTNCGAGAHDLATSVLAFTLDASYIYYLEGSSLFFQVRGAGTAVQTSLPRMPPVAIASDGTTVFYLSQEPTGAIESCPVSGLCGSFTQVGPTVSEGHDMLVSGDSIFYATGGTDHTIYRLTK